MKTFLFQKYRTGFTIVELLIVIVVIGILATLSFVAYTTIQKSAIDTTLRSDMENVEGEVARYGTKHSGAYGAAVQWSSADIDNTNITTELSNGNIVDVNASTYEYCIRGYNPISSNKTLGTALTKESAVGACTRLAPFGS